MLWSSIGLALREIRRNGLRSALTMLGIIIGVAAVITMVTLGRGATAQVTADISGLGSNLLTVRPGQMRGGPGGASAAAEPLDEDDVEAIEREIPLLVAVSPSSFRSATAILGNENWSTTATGVTNAYFEVGDWQLADGRRFTEAELQGGRAVCILGETVKNELFGGQSALAARIRLGSVSCSVVGVLEEKGDSSFGQDRDDVVLMPLRTYQRRLAGNRDVARIQVSVADGVSTEKVQRDIEVLLREHRRIGATEEDDFMVEDMKEIADTLTGTTQVLTRLLGAVAAVSLLVGGIGIMNIMLVSVTERTREIGIRLAIGALEREVLQQFLVEAVVLTSLGGLIGVILALIGSLVLSDVLSVPFVFDPEIVSLAFLFSATVGMIFGYFPARKAARLDPIEALRHE